MTTPDKVREELTELSRQLPSLAQLARERDKLPLFVAEYQRWYTRSVRLVTLLGSDRLAEFEGYYLADPKRRLVDDTTYTIQDYILDIQPAAPSKSDLGRAVALRLTAQVSILQSLESRIEGVFSALGGELLADFETSELEAARKLLKVSPRAAGILTFVVLENHLFRVARHHDLKIPATRTTVKSLSDLLKEAGICDEPTWRRARALFDQQDEILKDKKSEPDVASVEALISELQKILKAVV